jgi:diguanylate cyclase (GGDEF)-like protein
MALEAVAEQSPPGSPSRQPYLPGPGGRGPGHNCCRACGQPLGYWAIDWLTGLLDRWGWDEHAPRAHNDACQGRRSIALLAIDLDRFKRINDEHGHPVGDAVLQSAATVLQQATRTTDLVSRYGGDEFLVLAPDLDLDGALTLGGRIHQGIRTTATTAQSAYGRPVTISDLTASVGLAVQHPERPTALFDLVLQADTALRHAKRLGRDLISIANSAP